jgi:hypothetical protein
MIYIEREKKKRKIIKKFCKIFVILTIQDT